MLRGLFELSSCPVLHEPQISGGDCALVQAIVEFHKLERNPLRMVAGVLFKVGSRRNREPRVAAQQRQAFVQWQRQQGGAKLVEKQDALHLNPVSTKA
jgi:hypothetical protein